jgi:hypothetical protein
MMREDERELFEEWLERVVQTDMDEAPDKDAPEQWQRDAYKRGGAAFARSKEHFPAYRMPEFELAWKAWNAALDSFPILTDKTNG